MIGARGRWHNTGRRTGTPYQAPLAQLITHVVNHGTAHRAETGMLLERLGRSPGDMDYVYFHLGR